METRNLWPDFAIEKTRSPKAILKEQAGYLMAKTNNVLSADVETTSLEDNLIHHFYVIAPALNNYRYELFTVTHKIVGYYPVTFDAHTYSPWEEYDLEARDEKEFVEKLAVKFKKDEVVNIISSLLSQSLAE